MEKTLKRLATMQRLQTKGLELFYKNGYGNTSIDDILKTLELSKGAFYHHFKSKEDYFVSIVQHLLFKKIYSLLIEPVEGKEDPSNTIVITLENALDNASYNEMDYGFVLGNFITEFNGRHKEIMGYLNDILKVWEVTLITAIQKGKTDNFIARRVDSEAVATYIISSYLGIRTLMVEGNSKTLRYKYISQLRQYMKTLSP